MIQQFHRKETDDASHADRAVELYGLIGLVLLGLMFWGARSLWDSSEARYGQVAFEMLRNGNWLLPTLAGEPHLTKPPFAYWMVAMGMKLFGINAWGARFFLAVFFTGTIFCLRELARTMGYDRRASRSAAFIFATGIVPFIGGHTLTTDAFLTFWETFGVLAAWKVWQGAAQPSNGWRLVFWGAFGMGFFTKGPPALLPSIAIGGLSGCAVVKNGDLRWSLPPAIKWRKRLSGIGHATGNFYQVALGTLLLLLAVGDRKRLAPVFRPPESRGSSDHPSDVTPPEENHGAPHPVTNKTGLSNPLTPVRCATSCATAKIEEQWQNPQSTKPHQISPTSRPSNAFPHRKSPPSTLPASAPIAGAIVASSTAL